MCKEFRNRYEECRHPGFRTFELCNYATDTLDAQGQYAKNLCEMAEIIYTDAGMCHECTERVRRAEEEAIAAYIQGRR